MLSVGAAPRQRERCTAQSCRARTVLGRLLVVHLLAPKNQTAHRKRVSTSANSTRHMQELREKVVVRRTSTGAIREFQLRLRYRFRVRSRNGIELIPDTEIMLTRDINFNETGALSKESEEGLLYKDMETDLVLQLQRRLAAIRQI